MLILIDHKTVCHQIKFKSVNFTYLGEQVRTRIHLHLLRWAWRGVRAEQRWNIQYWEMNDQHQALQGDVGLYQLTPSTFIIYDQAIRSII